MGTPFLGGSASMSYDRSILVTSDDIDIRGKLSVEFLGVLGDTYQYQSLALGMITGKYNNHFELFAGAALNQSSTATNAGIRRLESKGVFRLAALDIDFKS